MPFSPASLSSTLVSQLATFVSQNNFLALYQAYTWRNDTFASGFKDILALELRLTTSDKTNGITLNDVQSVANWGALRNHRRIAGQPTVLPPNSLHAKNGAPLLVLWQTPTLPITQLQHRITRGIGPTYLSKIIRFGLPQEYGAIDTRCVRVFGQGDPSNQRHNWITLKAQNSGSGWFIPTRQTAWPGEYSVWINILRYFASVLPKNCPHPPGFYKARLRRDGIWECADVEMALFVYASQHLRRAHR